MSDRDDNERPADERHLYGRRAYDHGPPPGAEDRRAGGDAKANGQPAQTHALQKSEPRALKRFDQAEADQQRAADRRDDRPPGEARKTDQERDHDQAGRKHRPPEPHIRPGLPRLLLIGLVIALLVAGLAAGLLFWRHHHRLAKEADRRGQEVDRGPKVFVTTVRSEPGVRELTLPADVRGFSQATVYAKVAGYVKSIAVDKGDSVKRGQLLGVLESPEVDQQVAAAEADVVVKKRTFERYRHLVAKDFVSQQDFENAKAQFEVAEATLKQARAMQSYEVLRAPFSGTITARYVDPGALVPAATGSTQSALPLVDIADLDRLRILLFVQQDAAPFIHAGDLAEISVDERPDLQIKAPVTRVSNALDPRSRTMLCEIWLANDHHLFPGTFVHVTLRLKMASYPIVPSASLIIHENKSSLAVIKDDQVHFIEVKPGLDDGHNVQIKQGVQPGEKIAVDLPAELAEGARVQPEEKKDTESKEGGAPGGGQKKGEGQDTGGDEKTASSGGKPRDGAKGGAASGDDSAPQDRSGKPRSPGAKGAGKLSDDPMAGSSK